MARAIRVLGIDIAMLVCHVVGMNDAGPVVLRTRLARSEWLHVYRTVAPTACGQGSVWAYPRLGPACSYA
jgi:hypothetical protein